MFTGIRTTQTPEGDKYELHWGGKSKVFDDREKANGVLALHMAREAGRKLTPEEERELIDYQPTEKSDPAGSS